MRIKPVETLRDAIERQRSEDGDSEASSSDETGSGSGKKSGDRSFRIPVHPEFGADNFINRIDSDD